MTSSLDRTSSLRPLRPVLVSVLALALAACASSRGLQPQATLLDADSLQTQRTLSAAGLSQPGWPATDWWRALGDPQLDALIAEGLQRNPGLDAADARLRQARAQIGTAHAERLPSVSASGGYTGVRLPESMVGDELGGSYAGSGQAYLSFSYGIDLWGGKRAAWEAAVDSGHAAEVDAQAARLNLSAAIAEAYAQLGYAYKLHDVASEELARSQKTLDLTAQRRRAGIDSDLQTRQAEARIPAAQQQQQAAQQQIDEARTALAALVGQGPDRGLQIERPQVLNPLALQLPGVLPSALLGRRPDIVAARWRVEAANRQIHAAKAQFYPSLNLTALGGVVSSEVDQLLKSGSTFAFLGPALSLPIFDGGRLRAQLGKAAAGYDLAVAHYNQTVIGALKNISDQLIRRESMNAQAHFAAQSVAAAQKTYDIATVAFQRGLTDYLNVLQAQTLLFRQQQVQQQVQAARLIAHAELVTALGGGLQAGSDVPDQQHQEAPPTPPALTLLDRTGHAR